MKHIPRKRFGQNFLTDDVVLHDIIRSIAPAADDAMVEIGPAWRR
jgi:16S rRNA (adenine1518-N6/adenine1519-N6)-dimethyltransferase